MEKMQQLGTDTATGFHTLEGEEGSHNLGHLMLLGQWYREPQMFPSCCQGWDEAEVLQSPRCDGRTQPQAMDMRTHLQLRVPLG